MIQDYKMSSYAEQWKHYLLGIGVTLLKMGKNCVVRSVATGWTGLAELASDVKEEAMKMYTEQDGGGAGGDGNVNSNGDGDAEKGI